MDGAASGHRTAAVETWRARSLAANSIRRNPTRAVWHNFRWLEVWIGGRRCNQNSPHAIPHRTTFIFPTKRFNLKPD